MRPRTWIAAGSAALAVGAPITALAVTQTPGARTRAHLSHKLRSEQLPTPPPQAIAAAKRVRPIAFRSCAALVRYARSHFARTRGVPDPPLPPVSEPTTFGPASRPSAPTAALGAPTQGSAGTGSPAYSTTNVQEPGVDEPDTVKTDGTTIFTVSQNVLYAVGTAGGTPTLEGSLNLGPGGFQAKLLLRGSRLIVILGSPNTPVPLGAGRPALPASRRPSVAVAPSPPAGRPASAIVWPSPYYYRASTTVEEVDVSNPAAMDITRTMSVEGSFVDARQNGSTARLVIASAPRAIATPGVRAQTAGWLPRRRFHSLLTGRRYSRPVTSCAAVARPAQFSGLGTVSILTLNLDKGLWTAGSDAMMADAQVIYGSTQSLYIATQKWVAPQTPPDRLAPQTTVIDRFDATAPSATPFVAAGEVPGYLLNQFSLSEFNGYLRVATTSSPVWWPGFSPQPQPQPQPHPRAQAQPQSQSYVTVLATEGAALVPVGQVSGLGVGQKIYSVRFVDNAGYVVTFRQIDPLYTIDLSTPTAPKVAGQLELKGYSSYLHPLGGGLLLGVGQSVSANEPDGAQLELFDVSDPATPKLLARTSLGSGSNTAVQYDHHAFLYWNPTKLAVLPVQIYPAVMPTPAPAPGQSAPPSTPSNAPNQPPAQTFTGAIGFNVDRGAIAEVGRISHDPTNGYAPPIDRSLVIGDRLFTLSAGGVMSSRLDTLVRVAFVAFPQPQPQPGASGTGTAKPGHVVGSPAGS